MDVGTFYKQKIPFQIAWEMIQEERIDWIEVIENNLSLVCVGKSKANSSNYI
jgi:hypothetical protein